MWINTELAISLIVSKVVVMLQGTFNLGGDNVDLVKSTLGEDLKEYKVVLRHKLFKRSDIFFGLLVPCSLGLQLLIFGSIWIDLWIILMLVITLWRIHGKFNTVIEGMPFELCRD
jgi:hypothetical protein